MDYTFFIAIATMGGLGFIFAGGLAFANKKLYVEENPKIAEVTEVLPGANCGACGKAGCYDFAVNIVEGKMEVTGCPVGGEETASAIAEILGIDAGTNNKLRPVVLCHGGKNEAVNKKSVYLGPGNCSVAAVVSGGEKLCFFGCLGGGDCVEACPFDAMIMNDNGIPEVIDELCTGCGLCAKACPRNVIEMHPESHNVFVFCKNHDDPKTAKEVCSVSCFGCGICARKSEGAIEMNDFLPEINYEKLNEELIPSDKCKTGAIGKLKEEVLNKNE